MVCPPERDVPTPSPWRLCLGEQWRQTGDGAKVSTRGVPPV